MAGRRNKDKGHISSFMPGASCEFEMRFLIPAEIAVSILKMGKLRTQIPKGTQSNSTWPLNNKIRPVS